MKKFLILSLCAAFSLPLAAQSGLQGGSLQLLPVQSGYRSESASPVTPEYTRKGMRVYSGGVRLTVPEVKNAFMNTPAYKDYRRGVRFNRIGHGLLWPGVGVSAFGMAFIIADSRDRDDGDGCCPSTGGLGTVLGTIFLVPGIALVITGTTLTIVGKKKVASSVRTFNAYRYGDYSAKLSFGPTSNGLGVSLMF